MRSLVLMAVLLIAPGTAFAGSFTTIADRAVDAGSIISVGVAAPKVAPAPKKPTLLPGHEVIRLKQADGKTEIFRTEAWLGGSPVTYVTTATPDDLAVLKERGIDVASTLEQTLAPNVLQAAKSGGTPEVAGVDRHETTGSLGAGAKAAPAVKPLDAGDLKLRPTLGKI